MNAQSVRLRRFLMAAFTSLLFIALLFALYLQGLLGSDILQGMSAFVAVALLAFYAIFRLGLNRHFKDPSLTMPQIATSASAVLFVMYQSQASRSALAIVLGMILLFAVFRFGTRQLMLLAGCLIAGYAAVILLTWHFKPAPNGLRPDLADFMAMAIALPWFAWIGGHINALRDRLEQGKLFYETIWESCLDSIVVVDDVGRIDYVNPAITPLLGYAADELIGQPLEVLLENQGRTSPNAAVGVWKHPEGRPTLESVARRRDGQLVPVEVTLTNLEFDGHPGHVAFLRDIAERRWAQEHLAASEDRFRRLTALSSDWYWEQDDQFRYTMVSGGIMSRGGMYPSKVIGKTRHDLVSDPHWAEAEAHRELLEAHRPFRDVEYQALDIEGATRWFSTDGEPLFDSGGRFLGYYGTDRDITERKRSEEQIRYNANHDILTGLANRNLLRDRLNHDIALAARMGRAIWVVFVDLDRFKIINDSLSHKAGDALLCQVAERLRSATRETDTIARQGGDEFVLVLPQGTDGRLGKAVLDRLLESLTKPFEIEGQTVHVTCSAGIAAYPDDGQNAEELIEHADVAMYRAKEAGRNTYHFYTAAMNAEATRRLRMENDLRAALDRGEFELHYQPQVSLPLGKVVGMEALLRWRHPMQGLLAPSAFIGVAEEMGLIVPLGEWVARTACAQARRWNVRHQRSLCVSINVSARQFANANLVEAIGQALAESGLDAGLLDIELTESLIMDDIDHGARILQELRKLGVRLSIDDFGTGYSSLAYLKRLPVDVLKIDRSFVTDIEAGNTDAAIAASIIGLARNLGLEVIAEGVETAEQCAFLRAEGCTLMQGYLFSRPLPVEDFEEMLTSQQNFLQPA